MANIYKEQGITDVQKNITLENSSDVLIGPIKYALGKYEESENKKAQEFEKKAQESMELYERGMQNLTSQSMKQIYESNKTDPIALQKEFDKLSADIIDTIPDENTRINVKANYILDSQTYLNQSQNNLMSLQKRQLNQRREESLYNTMDLYTSSLTNLVINPNENDLSNVNRYRNTIETMLKSKDENGLYVYSPSQQKSMKNMLDKYVVENFSQSFNELPLEERKNFITRTNSEELKKYGFNEKSFNDLKKSTYKSAYFDYMQNPTEEGKNILYELNPNMSEKTKDELDEVYYNSPNYEAISVFDSIQEVKGDLDNFKSFEESDYKDNAEYFDKITKFVAKLQRSNAKGTLSDEDVNKYSNLVYRAANDKVFAKQVHSFFGKPSTFDYIKNWPLGTYARVENIGLETMQGVVDSLLNNEPEIAMKIYQEGQKKAIQERYPAIPFDKLKEGDIIWYANTKQALKFMGYSLDDILVEVDPNTGAVK